jgi:PAS domain S-box-containing protein
MRIRLGLRTKLAIAFLLVLFPVLGLVLYDYLDDNGRAQGMVLQGQLRTAEAVSAMVDATFDQAVAVGEALAVDPNIHAFSTTYPSLLDPYLARYNSIYPQYGNINVWDAGGQNAGASMPITPDEPRPSIADREHFQRTISTGSPAVSNLIVSRIGGGPTAAVAVPIKDDLGHIKGVITLLLDLQAFSDRLQTMKLAPDQSTWLVDGSGRLALHTGLRELSWDQRDVSWYQPVRETLARGSFAGRVERSLTGDSGLVAASICPEYGWVAGVAASEQAVLVPVQRAGLIRLLFYLGIVLIGSALTLGLTAAITRPLRRLTRSMAAFGRGELHERVVVNTGDELETTAQALNSMATALQREHARLLFLSETSTALSADLDIDRIIHLLAEKVAALLGEPSWVCLTTRGQNCSAFSSHSADSATGKRLLSVLQQHDESITRQLFLPVAETGRPLLIPDVASYEMDAGLRGELQGLGLHSLLVVPLMARGRPLGILAGLGVGERTHFGEDDLGLARDLGSRAGIVVDNALLFQQVRNALLRLQTVVETVPVGVVVAEGPGGHFSSINRSAEEILEGIPSPELTPEGWVEAFGLRTRSGEPYAPLSDPLSRTLLRGEGVAGEEVIMRRRDRNVWLLVHSAPLLNEQGDSTGAVMAFQDITALKEVESRMERLAREAEQRRDELDAVIEGMGEGIAIADREGMIERVNSLGREILGIGKMRLEGRSIADLAGIIELRRTDGSPLGVDQWPMSRAMRGELFSGEEAVQVRMDGSSRNLLFSSGVVCDDRGNVQLSMTLFRDITSIRELEQTREEFISVVAHDLRSPLTVIAGFAGLLQRLPLERHGQSQEQRAIVGILSSSKRLEKMVADLLDASRIEASRLVIAKEVVELPKLVQEVVERVAYTLDGHPIRVEVEGAIPPFEADPSRLEQLLVNLLTNAGKYSFPDTEIVVKLESRDGEVMVSVINWGQGISPEDREAIFARFRRTRSAETGKVPGLGLGLYIAKGLVEAHGGRLWVESEMGKTTTFRFTLPLQ